MIAMHPIATLAVLLLSAATAVAQSTTWTSFADRRGHAMARGPNGTVVMFGGQSMTSGEALRDTVQLTGSQPSWSAGQDGIEARSEHAMTAALVSGQPRYVVFGGLNNGGTPTNTTWRYDGSAWGDPVSGPSPSPRSKHTMVTHLGTQIIYLFGGDSGTGSLGDLWAFDPTTLQWQALQPTGTAPSPRSDHCMAYCSDNQRIYVFGGPSLTDNAMYEYTPATNSWIRKPASGTAPSPAPLSRREAAMTYVDGAQQIILFGGTRTGTALGDTWLYDPGHDRWSELTFQQPTPPARFGHAVSRLVSPNRIALLGGTNSANAIFEATWVWDANSYEWAEELPTPSSRNNVAMAYDSARGRHVIFGGRDSTSGLDLDETWEIDGLNWRRRTPSARPSARSDAGLAYDSARNRTVLFGGRGQGGNDLSDTWEWDGNAWSLRTPANRPPRSAGGRLVYDATRSRTWLFAEGRMWSFDGNNWSEASMGPASRHNLAGGADSGRTRLVINGGFDYLAGGTWTDTWTYQSGTWAGPINTSPSPGHSRYAATASDGNSMWTSGGFDTAIRSTTWNWAGQSWIQLANLPQPRTNACAAHAPGIGFLVFGGFDSNGSTSNTHWRLDGSGWSTLSPPGSQPAAVADAAMAYNPATQRILLFGGRPSQGQQFNSLWQFDGIAWTGLHTALRPQPRHGCGMEYDPATGNMILFGGTSSTQATDTFLQDTWAWDGSSWQQLNPGTRPSARSAFLMCRLGASQGMPHLFGGRGETHAHSDLWAWTGSNWQEVASGSPPRIRDYGVAYDERRQRLVYFGGIIYNQFGAQSFSNETWEWSGTQWVRRYSTASPSPRKCSAMSYDSSRSTVVLFGGSDANNTFQDTWEWDGHQWTQRSTATTPPGSSGHGQTYDTSRDLSVAFGGFGTWDYGPVVPASATPYGFGCATSGSNPPGFPLQIKKLPWTGPWLGDRLEVDFENRPAQSLGIFVWGFSNRFSATFGPLPLNLGFLGSPPGCQLRAAADITELILPNVSRYVSFVLPNHPSFLGAQMYGQAGFFDPGLPGSPIVTSNGIEMVFGQK